MTVTAVTKEQLEYPIDHKNAVALKAWVDAVTAIVNGTLPASMLSADTEGRAAMATGYFNEATATDKFAVGAIIGTLLKNATVPSGKLDANTQAVLIADGASTADVSDLDAFAVANDGLTMTEGQRVFLKDQTDPAENGLYTLGAVTGGNAPLTRSTDMNANAHLKPGTIVAVTGGTLGAGTLWQLTGDFPGDIATSHKHFVQVYNATQATAAGITIAKRTVRVQHTDLTDAVNGEAQVVNIGAALPANAVVLGSEVNIATLFSGGSASAVKLDIGGTNADAIAAQMDVFTGAATGALTPTPAGVHTHGKFSSEQLVATFTPDGGHTLDGLDAGDLTITVWYSVLA